MRNRAVFLDRDGVLNPDVGYPRELRDAELFPDVVPALLDLQKAGYLIIVVSNQSGIGRGILTMAQLDQFNDRLIEHLRNAGVRISRRHFYVCPHAPAANCDCRKPKPGLYMRAAQEHDIDLPSSISIGDRESDILAGKAAGTTAILLNRAKRRKSTRADASVTDLRELTALVLKRPHTSIRGGTRAR